MEILNVSTSGISKGISKVEKTEDHGLNFQGLKMESKSSDKVPSGQIEELAKNSAIAVTVDDLKEGVIVVSYTHNDDLYQGVLLQLNRERGIPCGISFPKDADIRDAGDHGKDPVAVEVPPLNQRHTYFQAETEGMKDRLPRLRRIIKPPSRYKNSRMNLRVRSRPVLCAKCQIFCDDKGAPVNCDNTEDDTGKKSSGNGVTTRRNQGKNSKPEENASSSAVFSTQGDTVEDNSFVSFGRKGLVENYWRRPYGDPVSKGDEKLRGGSGLGAGSSKLIGDTRMLLKSVPTIISTSNVGNSTGSVYPGGDLFKYGAAEATTRVVSLPSQVARMSSTTKKSKNLKLCLSKLTLTQCHSDHKTITSLAKEAERITRSANVPVQDNGLEHIVTQSKDFAKTWENRIRKRSTVPARFRDESYLTKNIFNFKRRRVDETAGEEADVPMYTSRIVSSDTEEHEAKSPVGDVDKTDACSDGSGSSYLSFNGVSSTNATNGIGDSRTEPAKTPVIKITFGSSGNGVVVQIPPKITQEDQSNVDSKAARKAMKKAKKEARRKMSMSRESSPSAKNALSPLSQQINSHSLSPSPPVLNPEYPLPSLCDDLDTYLPDRDPPPVEHMEPIHLPKKKKKEKKKKRSKVSKENDVSETISSQSSQSFSPEIQTCKLPDTDNFPSLLPVDTSESPDSTQKSDCNRSSDSLPEGNNISKHTEAHQRLCISLKRLDANAYVSWNNPSNTSGSNDELELSDANTGNDNSVEIGEPNDFPVNGPSINDGDATESLDFYLDEESTHTYKKGDIIWGKLPGCPWWPGKISDIRFTDALDVWAKVSWYKAVTQSYIRFGSLAPFTEFFEYKYTRSRRRGAYQQAVRDALVEAHEMNPEDLPSD